MPSQLTWPVNRVGSLLYNLGFTRARNDPEYRRNGTLFLPQGEWAVLRGREDRLIDPLCGWLGRPGLWKAVGGADGAFCPVFDLPPAQAEPDAAADPDLEPIDPLPLCIGWATATAQAASASARIAVEGSTSPDAAGESALLSEDSRARLALSSSVTARLENGPGSPAPGWGPDGWTPPARREIERWIGPQGLTVRHRSLARQLELVHRPDRLALRCAVVPRVSLDLPASRRRWLDELLIDAQSRWRMVRTGWTLSEAGTGAEAALAEVDFTGCPAAVLQSVFRTGLAALRWVVEWLVCSAVFLADAALPSAALEVCPSRA